MVLAMVKPLSPRKCSENHMIVCYEIKKIFALKKLSRGHFPIFHMLLRIHWIRRDDHIIKYLRTIIFSTVRLLRFSVK